MIQPPKEVVINYVVQIYKDMEFADEIETSNSFSSYEEALEFYNEVIEEVGEEQFVTLELEIEQNFVDISQLENLRLADNYMNL